jgi:hypothetical protein
MAPEFFNTNNGTDSGLSTRESDSFALAMITFEVRIIYRGGSFHDSETPFCTLLQVFTGQVPFAEHKTTAMATKKIADGERPPRTYPRGRIRYGRVNSDGMSCSPSRLRVPIPSSPTPLLLLRFISVSG